MRKLARVGRPARSSVSSDADVGQRHRHGRRTVTGGVEGRLQLGARLAELPPVADRHVGEVARAPTRGPRPSPATASARTASRSLHRAGRPARRAGRRARSRRSRHRRAGALRRRCGAPPRPWPRRPAAGRARSRQVFCGTPSREYGARAAASSPQRTPDATHPVADPLERLVVEPEAPSHRRERREVEHLRDREPSRRRSSSSRASDAEHRVGLPQRAVGQPDAQPMSRVGRRLLLVDEPEGRGDQRRERLDVGAHHQHVTQLERRVVVEQAEQHLAHHLDLAQPAVAGVHLHRPVRPSSARSAAGGRSAARSRWSLPSSVVGATSQG